MLIGFWSAKRIMTGVAVTLPSPLQVDSVGRNLDFAEVRQCFELFAKPDLLDSILRECGDDATPY